MRRGRTAPTGGGIRDTVVRAPYAVSMATSQTGWPRGRLTWILGTVLLFAAGIVIGLVLGSIWTGLILAAAISVGWLIAYESWRGRNVGVYDRDDDGAQL